MTLYNLKADRRFRRRPRDIFEAGPVDLFPGPTHGCKHASRAAVGLVDAVNARETDMDAPPREVIIETPRLVLRRHTVADFPAYFEICADPEMIRFSDHGPASSEQAWMRLLRHIGHWSAMGYGFLVVEEKATGRLVGEAGLAHFQRQLGPALDSDPEIGWAIKHSEQGKGYATEAAVAALEWMDRQFGLPRSICLIHTENAPSIRVAEKIGYRQLGECMHRSYRAFTFERLRPEARR